MTTPQNLANFVEFKTYRVGAANVGMLQIVACDNFTQGEENLKWLDGLQRSF